MCAMHIAFEKSQKFTVHSKITDLERPVEHSIIKEMANQGIKMRIRKVGKANKKPKQGWECTLEEVRDSVGQPIHVSRIANPRPEERTNATYVGTLERRPSEAVPFKYPSLDQDLHARSSVGSFSSAFTVSSMPAPMSTPTYPIPGPSTGGLSHPSANSSYQPGLASTNMEGLSHGVWNHNTFSSGYPTPGAFGNHSLNGHGFDFQHTTNNNLMHFQSNNMHNIQTSGYATANNPQFALPQLNNSPYGHASQEHFGQAPSHFSHNMSSFDSGHSGYN